MSVALLQDHGLTPLELASHVLFGPDDTATGLPRAGGSAIDAIEAALLGALRAPPCHVGFSGGRDSSALLAAATRIARRDGLPDPVPSTLRFAEAPQAAEQEWQELVVDHLALSDWIRLEVTHELDLVGPVAAAIMSDDGLPYPYNLHLLHPLIERARGGSFITGLGGDQTLLGAGRTLDVLARRVRPSRRDLLRIGVDLSPRPIRRRVLRSRVGLTFPWLRPEANRELARAWLEQDVRLSIRWDKRMHALWRSRFMQTTVRRIARLGEREDVRIHHPFADGEFVTALAAEGGPAGFVSRTAAFEALFGDDLPPALIARSTKASFNEVIWNRHTRSFVAGLDERRIAHALKALGVDALVDPAALWGHWQSDAPLANSFSLLQGCWLVGRRG